jgi:crossover junction endodeoxyribonuclease RuvC
MRVLGIDPGAKRLGWAVVGTDDAGYSLEESGVVTLEQRADEKWGAYRRRLIQHWAREFPLLLAWEKVDAVIFELQPPMGMNGVQQQLAKTVRDTLQAVCEMHKYDWTEYSPVTIKKNITGKGKATKVGVRNGVIAVFPELESRKKELTDVAEESDAIAIALVGLGYKVGSTASDPQGSPEALPRV